MRNQGIALIAALGASALPTSTLADYPQLPLVGYYEIYVPASGTLDISLTNAPDPTHLAIAIDGAPTVDYVEQGQHRSYTATSGQIIDFQLIDLTLPNTLWYPAGSNGLAAFSPTPQSAFDPSTQGMISDTWDFGAGGNLTFAYRYNPLPMSPSGTPLIPCALGEGPYHGPFERNMCSTAYCGNGPESWVRGYADIDRTTGIVSTVMQLETDAVDAGPSGTLDISLYDSAGNTLAAKRTPESAITGKRPGKSRIISIPGGTTVATSISAQVQSVGVQAACHRPKQGLFGTNLPDPTITILNFKF